MGQIFPEHFSKATGYPNFKVIVHDFLWSFEIQFMIEDIHIKDDSIVILTDDFLEMKD